MDTQAQDMQPRDSQSRDSQSKDSQAHLLTATFQDRPATERAFSWLQNRGYKSSEINVLMADKTRATYSDKGTEGQIKSGTHLTEGIAKGGAVGTAVGATVGAILAIGTTAVVPGLGWVVAGPIYAALAGGGVGAITGGAIGGLMGVGIPESNAKAYEEALKKGGVVFGVKPRSPEDATAIRKYFEAEKADNIVLA